MSEPVPLIVRRPVAAKMLGDMSVSTLEKLRDIPYFKVGSAVYYDVADLKRWIEAKKLPPLPVASPVAP